MIEVDATFKHLDVFPMVKYYIDELGLYEILKSQIPCAKQSRLEPAEGLCILIANILMGSSPLYKVDEWLSQYADGVSEKKKAAKPFHDNHLGWCLDRLFDSDRHTLLSCISSAAIRLHHLKTDNLRNDSTSITFFGAYPEKAGQKTKLKRGYNKDHRPDCKQIVFGLTTTDDGHVPIYYKAFAGNRTDDTTHQENWSELKALLNKKDFIYIADSKLCTLENIYYIADAGGKFITIMPASRKEVKDFYERIKFEEIPWEISYKVQSSRKKYKSTIYKIYEGIKSGDGHRMIWIHSSAKQVLDKKVRDESIKKTCNDLEAISKKLNRRNLKALDKIEKAVEKIVSGKKDFFMTEIIETTIRTAKKKGRGRPTSESEYEYTNKIKYQLKWSKKEKEIKEASKKDGIFPLTTNTELCTLEVLRTYKEQPYLEKRHQNLKSVLDVAPVFLENENRIEAMLFLYFISLMVISLIERSVRSGMQSNKIKQLPILPQRMKTKAPTWNNIRYFFSSVHQATINVDGYETQSKTKGLTELHKSVIDLAGIPEKKFSNLEGDSWWRFDPGCNK